MPIQEVAPEVDAEALLPGAHFVDAYRTGTATTLDARHAAKRMIEQGPRWVAPLMTLRNLIVSPFGLKTPASSSRSADSIGAFPLLSETPERVVAGFDDKHLDFRIVVDIAGAAGRRTITATTVVLTHNRLGRTYLACILPFHRLVVRGMLQRVAA
jgi:hypothetical protein